MKSTDIFTSLPDFHNFTDGMMADTTMEQLTPSIRTITQDIIKILSAEVYIAIVNQTQPKNAEDAKDIDMEEALELLKTAVANGAACKYQIFSSVKKNGSDASVYKYQHEEIKEHYQEAYCAAMDRLLDWLDANPKVGGWEQSDEYKKRQELPVKNAAEFDYYYGIGKSAFFFQKVLYLVRQIWKQSIQPVLPAEADSDMTDLAKQALCYQVIAQAVMQFDVTELPRSIRYDHNHEYSKGSSMQQRTTLYNQLMAKVESAMASIERMKAAASGAKAIQGSHVEESDKFVSVL